jgi:hypothetical protein
MIRNGWTDQWEVICPACGDRTSLDHSNASLEIQNIRGPHEDRWAALTALELHIGLNTPGTRRTQELGLA